MFVDVDVDVWSVVRCLVMGEERREGREEKKGDGGISAKLGRTALRRAYIDAHASPDHPAPPEPPLFLLRVMHLAVRARMIRMAMCAQGRSTISRLLA